MANKEHLRILREGVRNWNEWRTQHPEMRPNLEGERIPRVESDGPDEDFVEFGDGLGQANLHGVNLSQAHLGGADLNGANLNQANLQGADLRRTILRQASLSRANLQRANLRQADFTSANLAEADLRGADCQGAILHATDLTGADVHRMIVGWTVFGDVDLSLATGLESVRHYGPSTIGVDTIYASQGAIPEVFLRGAGVPDVLVKFIASLVGQPIQFYSCFISYSSKDQGFADRLYADLQARNVPCWFAPEDMKIGDKIRQRLDEAIRHYDKLLLLLSENSVESTWVEKEVETAFEEERRRKRTVLFPVRLDDSVMQTGTAWAADIRRTRHIGDFRAWKDHDAYSKSFDRLLRDLKAGELQS